MSRLARLADALIEPLLVTYGVNVTYLTGFESSNCALLVEPGGETTLYSDFRYAEAAQAVDGVSFVQTKRDVVGGLAELLAGRRVAFEAARISYDQYETLGGGGIELMPSRGVVERLRAVKDEQELDAIRRACAISDEVYLALAEEPVIGRTDTELAWWIERAFRERGAEALAFESIVAAGLNGAKPHAHLGAEVIPADTLVTFDVGCVVDGYCSDCTRTFATGELTSALADAYAIVRQAQLDGLAAVRARAHGRDVDAASRVAIEAAGLGENYGHGLGHGVGLEVHEAPTLRPESDDVLEAGNVVSVEPGLYLPGVGGCRIEDLVAVTEDGCEILTHFTKDLVTLS
jgi:Xaa-Pro aminopeptidase